MNYKLLICVKCKTEIIFLAKDLWRTPRCPRCDGSLVESDSNIK